MLIQRWLPVLSKGAATDDVPGSFQPEPRPFGQNHDYGPDSRLPCTVSSYRQLQEGPKTIEGSRPHRIGLWSTPNHFKLMWQGTVATKHYSVL